MSVAQPEKPELSADRDVLLVESNINLDMQGSSMSAWQANGVVSGDHEHGIDKPSETLQDCINELQTLSPGDPRLATCFMTVSDIFVKKHRRTSAFEDIKAVVKYCLAAVAGTPAGHSDLARMHERLGRSYWTMYLRNRNLNDLKIAFKHFWITVAETSVGDPDLPSRLKNLGNLYLCHDRYCRTGEVKILDSAVKYHLAAVTATAKEHPDLPAMYLNVGGAYNLRYKRTGELGDVEAGIQYFLAAVAAFPEGHPNLPKLLQNLGTACHSRYRRTGQLKDLDSSVKYNLAALVTIPKGHPDIFHRSQNLALCYYHRYRGFGDLKDLEDAISYLLKAVAVFPEGHQDLASAHNNLGIIYCERYHKSRSLDDLQSGIKYYLKALADTADKHRLFPYIHKNLGSSYQDRFVKIGDFGDLEAGLKHSLTAVAATPEGHSELCARHSDLGIIYIKMYTKTGHQEDLKSALKYNLLALNATPLTHPYLPHRQVQVAKAYALKYLKSAHVGDLDKSYNLFKSALQSERPSPQQCWDIAIEFIYQTKVFTAHQLLEGYGAALGVLPSVLWLGSSLSTRHDTIIRHKIPDLISDAVIAALQDSDTQLAIKFLEQGLSTTHKQILQLKDEHIMLQAQLPILSQRLQEVSVQLQGASQTLDPTASYHTFAHERRHLILRIRKQPGFEDFLLAPQYPKLRSAAKYGPVVMLNYSHNRSDAIIILSPLVPPVHISLSAVSAWDVADHIEKLKSAFKEFSIRSREIRYGGPRKLGGLSSDKFLGSTVSWLWKNVVKHIFGVLNKNGINDGRLWWCPSGLFTYLPLHAAAPLDSPFVQSYTPTLEALIHANQMHDTSPTVKSPDNLTAVGVIKTSTNLGSWAELPYVENELNTVTRLFGKQAQQLKDSQATIESVTKAIQSSTWLHLACHGHQDPADPLKSSLVLYDGQLELGQVLDLNLSNAKFVYLSACETAMGDSKLANEAMHLAGGFLAAGFLGAIGTIWSMSDAHGPKVARIVYKTILEENNIPDVRQAAYGLHLAIQKLRREGAPFHQWMPFIHLGI